MLGAVAAVAAVVALGIGLWASGLSSDLDDTREALERERAAAAIVADAGRGPWTSRREPDDSSLPRTAALLVLDDLGPAPSGQTYQAWIIEGENPISAGIFPGEEGVDDRPRRRRRRAG